MIDLVKKYFPQNNNEIDFLSTKNIIQRHYLIIFDITKSKCIFIFQFYYGQKSN